MHHARAPAGSHRAPALVLAVERSLPRTQRSHDLSRHVVLAVHATRILAGEKKQRGSAIDHDAPDVHRRRAGDARTVFDLELETDEIGNLVPEPGSLVLSLASLGKSQRCGAVLAKIHYFQA